MDVQKKQILSESIIQIWLPLLMNYANAIVGGIEEDRNNWVSFYHSDLDKVQTVKLLRNFPIGTYLLRNSTKDSGACFTLCIRAKTNIVNVRIFKNKFGQFYIDSSNTNRRTFPNLDDLFHYYGEVRSDRTPSIEIKDQDTEEVIFLNYPLTGKLLARVNRLKQIVHDNCEENTVPSNISLKFMQELL